jgi:hypothetical protein
VRHFLAWAAVGWPQGYGWRWRLVFEPSYRGGRRGGGPAATNTKATQVRVQEKINTPVTRTRRHSPAHGGTIARMSV